MDGKYLLVIFQTLSCFVDGSIPVQNKNADGSYGHCEMNIGGCTMMFSNSIPEWEARTGDYFIYVENADKTFQLAKEAGATVVMELRDLPYGRSGGVKDAYGNIWWITTL